MINICNKYKLLNFKYLVVYLKALRTNLRQERKYDLLSINCLHCVRKFHYNLIQGVLT